MEDVDDCDGTFLRGAPQSCREKKPRDSREEKKNERKIVSICIIFYFLAATAAASQVKTSVKPQLCTRTFKLANTITTIDNIRIYYRCHRVIIISIYCVECHISISGTAQLSSGCGSAAAERKTH